MHKQNKVDLVENYMSIYTILNFFYGNVEVTKDENIHSLLHRILFLKSFITSLHVTIYKSCLNECHHITG